MHAVEPQDEEDWRAYFELRWRVLRTPWGQVRGSERDEFEMQACHRMIRDAQGQVLAVGRIHQHDTDTAQIRYMAIAPRNEGRGLGRRMLRSLEDWARNEGYAQIELNARVSASGFYRRNGYEEIGAAPTLFGCIRHVRMRKKL